MGVRISSSLLLSWVFTLHPLNMGTLDLLDLVLSLIFKAAAKSGGLEEVVVLGEYHSECQNHVLGNLVLGGTGLDVEESLHNLLILFLDLVPDESVCLHGSDPEIWHSLFALEIGDVSGNLFLLFLLLSSFGWNGLDDGSNFLFEFLVGVFEPINELTKFGHLSRNDLFSFLQERFLFLSDLLLKLLAGIVELVVKLASLVG